MPNTPNESNEYVTQTKLRYPVITIDGPSGAGKGTVCLKLAQALGYQLLDSGALYRIVGLKAHQAGLLDDLDSTNLNRLDKADKNLIEEQLAQLTQALDIQFLPNTTTALLDIVVDGDNVTDVIRNETVGGYASQVAVFPKVREALLHLQQQMATRSGLVADGRDMGTVVFADADAKVYLTATAKARAERRVQQLQQAGKPADYDTILANIQARDERDENRSTSPSKPADDALVIDSSNMSVQAVFEQIKAHCQRQGICF